MNLRKEWDNLIEEIHDKPKCRTHYPKQVVFVRELLLIAQIILMRIELGQNVLFNRKIYRKVMSEYFHQKLLLQYEGVKWL